jgi:hypothetical protein
MPWLVGVLLQHRGRSPEQAGALVTLELALLAAAAILLGSQIHRVPRRTLALIGHVCGTAEDPQDKAAQVRQPEAVGAFIVGSNVEAALLAAQLAAQRA